MNILLLMGVVQCLNYIIFNFRILNLMTLCLCKQKSHCVCKKRIHDILNNLASGVCSRKDNIDCTIPNQFEPQVKREHGKTFRDGNLISLT